MTDTEKLFELLKATLPTALQFSGPNAADAVSLAMETSTIALAEWEDWVSERTGAQEERGQDVSDELLAQLINCTAEASNAARLLSDEKRINDVFNRARAVQRARAAGREG